VLFLEQKKRKWHRLDSRGLSNLMVVCGGVLLYQVLTHLGQVQAAIASFLDVLTPFIVGFVIAYMLNAPTNFFERNVFSSFKQRRMLSIVTVFILTLMIIVILLNLVIPQVVDSVIRLGNNMSDYLGNLNTMVQDFINRFHLNDEGLLAQFHLDGSSILNLMDTYKDILRQAVGTISSAIPNLLNFGVALGNGVVTALTALIASIYMLSGKKQLIAQLKKLMFALFPAHHVQSVLRVCSQANEIFVGFINGKLIDSAIIGVLCFFLTLIFRIPYAVLISVVIGVTNVIPFFGPIIGAVPCVMILVLVDPWAALRFGVIIIGLQQFDGNILGPKILGNSTGLSALWVLVAIVVGGGLFSFPGMLLGVPTFAVIYSLIRQWANEQLKKKKITANGESLDLSPDDPDKKT